MVKFPEIPHRRMLLDITPLVDLVFLLLIFFMVGSQFTQPVLDLTLPEARSGSPRPQGELVLTLTADRRLLIDGREIDRSGLEGELRARLSAAGDRPITLRADGRVPFREFVSVMDIVRITGARALNIEYRPEQSGR